MKKLFTHLAAVLFAGSMMAAVVNLYYTATFLKGTSANGDNISDYTKTGTYTTNGMSWTIPGNNTNGDYIRIGGKSLDNVDRSITSQAVMGDDIAKLVISHAGISRNDVSVPKVTVTVASDADFQNDVVSTVVTAENGDYALVKSTAGTIEILPASGKWNKDSYYKITFTVSNSSSSNGGGDVKSLAFYSYQDASAPSITAEKVNFDLCLTQTGSVEKTAELVVTGANLTNAITYSVNGANTSVTGDLTTTGGTLNVKFSANADGEYSDTIILTSGTLTQKVAVEAVVLTTAGNGSKEAPFSAADVVKINNRLPLSEKYWVQGYMVGCAANGGELAASLAATNVALGDAADQTTNCVPVELPSGEIRTALNLVDNAGYVGRQVKVYGQLISYFLFTGVKAISDYELIALPAPAVANFCKTEIGHFAAENADPNSFVLLSIGSKNGKTIVRIDQDGEKNTQMFDYLQVTGLTQTGEDVAEGGAAAMAVEFDTPALTNDSMTLEILWSTVNWPGRWMVQNLRVAVAECEYAVIPKAPLVPKTCSEVYSMAKNDEVALSEVTVTYVNGKNVYVKDASGAMLLYLPANATWKAGDKLAGIEGVVDIYNGLYEIKPTAEQVAAVVATAGEAPAPVELAVAPVAADVNKYVILKNVSVAAGEFVTSSATNLDLTIGEATVVLRNNFKLAQVFDADAKYNIVAAVAIYNTTIQLYFISAEEIIVPALNIMAYGLKAGDVADNKVTIDYTLNATATAVEIQLLDAEGAVKKSFDATGLKKGANQEVLDLEGVAAGTYNWAVKATAKPNNAAEPIQVATAGSGSAMGRAVTIDNSYESPYYGNIYQTCGLGVGLYGFDAALNPLFNGQPVAKNGWTAASNSSPCAATVGEDGLVYINDWSDSKPNVRIFNPATPEADAKDVFGGTASGTKGHMVNEAGDTIHASMRYCYPKGTGENTVLYTVDEDYKPGDVTHVFTYNIGTAETPWTSKPSGEGFTHAMTGG